VFRSVGYRGVALPDVPFDERSAVIPNREGRVMDVPSGEAVVGLYAVGWIKRGPSGIIGTNKPDAVETVDHLLHDARAGAVWMPDTEGEAPDLRDTLRARGTQVVDFSHWQQLDAYETQSGQRIGRPRVKLTQIAQMLALLSEKTPKNP
jgi:ferredoxin--NADP+ reductase